MPKENTFAFEPGFGSYRFGNGFWPDAKPNVDSVVKRLKMGTSISLFGLRRIGKSSLLAEARERLRASGENVVRVDFDNHRSLTEALTAILNAFPSSESAVVEGIRKKISASELFPMEFKARIGALISSKVDSSMDSNLDKYASALFGFIGNQIAEMESDSKPIFIFDELTVLLKTLIEGADETEQRKIVIDMNQFLGYLRKWRSGDVGTTMAICGSISIEWLQRKYGIYDDRLNDCVPILIQEMDYDGAKGLFNACVQAESPVNWTADCTNALLDFLPAYFPGVIQLAYDTIVQSEDASIEMLNGPIRKQIDYALDQQYYKQFASRFSNYTESERIRANKLFKKLTTCSNDCLEFETSVKILSDSDTDEFNLDGRELLDYLISDCFLNYSTNKGVSYYSGLVKSWRDKH